MLNIPARRPTSEREVKDRFKTASDKMVHLRKSLVWGLLIMGLLAVHAASAEEDRYDMLKSAMEIKAARWGTMKVMKAILRDTYRVLIREGLTPKISRSLLRLDQNYGDSPFHILARTWHAALMFQLTAAKIPESWKTAAAAAHKKLGGRGDFIQALPTGDKRGGALNMTSGPLREEFLSHAMFFLRAFVPEDISECKSMKLTEAEKCVGQYEEQLQTALLATFSSFFQYVVPRTPSSRIAPISFVFAAVSPCPFGYLVEPAFVARALQGAPRENLRRYASIKRVAKAKPCPELRKALLRVLLLNGVTPADMVRAKNMKDEFGKINASVSDLMTEEGKKITAASTVDPKSLLTEGEAEPEQVLAQLAAYIEAIKTDDVEGSLAALSSQSPVSQRAQLESAKEGPSPSADFIDRAKMLLEGQNVSSFKPPPLTMEDLVQNLSEAIAAEAKANPHRAALKPDMENESLEAVAQEVLKKMRDFDLQTKKFLSHDKDEKK